MELDLHEVYGADWSDPSLERPWPWWRDRIFGLLGTDSRLFRRLVSVRESETPRTSTRTT